MYYVYRFKDKEGNILYVGRTKDLLKRLKNHEHLDKEICNVEYIKCSSEAEMVWKEIYYINLYYNELSRNISDVYNNERMQDIGLKDTWINCCYYSNIIDEFNIDELDIDYSKITIIDHEKLNGIGNDKYDLSEKWFRENPSKVKRLKNNLLNYYINLIEDDSKNKKCLWITYLDHYDDLKGKGYTKGYYYRADANKSDKIYLAYLENNFIKNATIEEQDNYALSHILYFISQSGIREGKRITVYIPSKRMRMLLEQWIQEQKYDEE